MDHTTLECLMRCEQECVYRHIRHLTTPTESLATFFGRVVHEGVRVLYEAEKEVSGEGGWGVVTHRAAIAAAAYWQHEVESGRVVLPDAAAGSKPDHRTPQLAAAIVRLYAAAYPPARRGYDVVMNERYLEFPAASASQEGQGMMAQEDKRSSLMTRAPQALPSAAVECGIVDRVVRRHADGLLYVLDLKTSSWAPNKGYWRQWSNSQQAAIYLDLVEAALGESPAGFWCDHIYASGRRDGPRPEDFVQFGPVAYSEAKRAELREQRVAWRNQFAVLQEEPDRAVQSTRSCFRFNSACPYLGYCSADPQDREAMIERDMQVGTLVERPWNPAERDV